MMLLLLATLSHAWADVPGLVVNTTLGPVRGNVSVDGSVNEYLGIPYAATTGGANRFMPPQPRAPWTETRDASVWGNGCVQPHHNPDVPNVLSEDCLNINVYVPKTSPWPTTQLPVYVFFHGGAFEEGSNQGPYGLYHGRNLAASFSDPAVVVAINYRLYALGFVALPADDKTGINGNMGFLDQQMGLRWVRDNIASFGGDPARVTIGGESAGGMSVGLHMCAPDSQGLFSQAIMESNPSAYHYRTLQETADYGKYFLKNVGCKDKAGKDLLACLQSANISDIFSAYDKAGSDAKAIVKGNWRKWLDAVLQTTPVIGGPGLPINVQDCFASNKSSAVPLLAGANNNEGTTFVYAAFKKSGVVFGADYELGIHAIFHDKAEDVLTRYPSPGALTDARDVLSKLITDFWFQCGTQRLAMTLADRGIARTYTYRFTHQVSFSANFSTYGLPEECTENRTCHEMELPFVFGNFLTLKHTVQETAMAKSLGALWSSFIAGKSPTDPSGLAPTWPQFERQGRKSMVLGDNQRVESLSDLCGFWDSVGYDY